MHHISEIELETAMGESSPAAVRLFVIAEMVGYDCEEYLVEWHTPYEKYRDAAYLYLRQTFTTTEDNMEEILAMWRATGVARDQRIV